MTVLVRPLTLYSTNWPCFALKMANECAYASPVSATPLTDGENKENRQESAVIGTRSSEMRLISVDMRR